MDFWARDITVITGRKANRVGKEENTQQFPVASLGDEKGGERGITSDSGDAKGNVWEVNISERGKWSIVVESTQCLTFWLCTAQMRGKGTSRNVEYNTDGETLIGK